MTAGIYTRGPVTAAFLSGNLLESGEETLVRGQRTDSSTITSQRLALTYFNARKSETTSAVRFWCGSTAAATVTLIRAGLWTIAANGDGTLVASTPNDTALLGTPSAANTKSWSVPYAKVAGVRYAVGILSVATTAGSMIGTTAATGFGAELAVAPRLSGGWSNQTDLPSSFTDANITATSPPMYFALIP